VPHFCQAFLHDHWIALSQQTFPVVHVHPVHVYVFALSAAFFISSFRYVSVSVSPPALAALPPGKLVLDLAGKVVRKTGIFPKLEVGDVNTKRVPSATIT
jgi:hypothetical protein